METAQVNGAELEYEAVGSGEPVLLIDPVLPDAFLPLAAEPTLAERFRLVRYHKRGWVGSSHTPPPVTIADHAADAAALLDVLGLDRVHVAGHSSGASVALQLALDHPGRVHTLCLLEPTLFSVASGERLLLQAGPAFEAYTRGDHREALGLFMSVVSGLDWPACHALLDERVPGLVEQTLADADTLFGVELPALAEWTFSLEHAAQIRAPALSVLGARTEPLWFEVDSFVRSALPHVEQATIAEAGHLLQLQQPAAVARSIAEFLARHPLTVPDVRTTAAIVA